MKKHFKTYLISLSISILLILFPWLIGEMGIVSLFDVFGLCAPISAIIAIVLSLIYIVNKTSSWKTRIIIFILNPSIYYLIIWLILLLVLYRADLSGFERLHP